MKTTNVSVYKQPTALQDLTRDLGDAVARARERLDEDEWGSWVETAGCLFDRLRVDEMARRWVS